MKKASKAILGGLIGAVGAGAGVAQAGLGGPPGPVGLDVDSDFDLNVVCKPDGSEEFLGADGCFYEVSWRCDGTPAEAGDTGTHYGITDAYGTWYGVCISGSFAGGEFMGASWAADLLVGSAASRENCESADYGFYGWFFDGPFGPPVGFDWGEWTALNKLEDKITTADRGNGKPDHPGQKGDADNWLTVEIELKRTGECLPTD